MKKKNKVSVKCPQDNWIDGPREKKGKKKVGMQIDGYPIIPDRNLQNYQDLQICPAEMKISKR